MIISTTQLKYTYTFSKIIILVSFCGIFLSSSAQTPNVLLIIADDLGTDALKGYTTQSLLPTTPTIDSLRAIGVTFSSAWSSPVCTPTRASIMSGKHGSKTGVFKAPGNLDTSHISILKVLKEETNDTYAKAVIGKWHISNPSNPLHPTEHGADYYMGLLGAFPEDYSAWSKTENGITTTDSTYITSTLTDRAITWTSQQTKPWLLWLAHAAPHSPFHEPPSHMYTIPNPTTNTRKFLAMIESVDFEINRLLSSMTTAERDNTLIIFIGDNGTPGNVLRDYPSGHGKSTVYEGGIRVPFIVAGAGVTRKGERESAMVNVADIYATILEMTGSDLDGGLNNSLSFKHLLTGTSEQANRDYNYAEIKEGNKLIWAIRNHQYKLITLSTGEQEFYDLLTDSFEYNPIDLNNLTSEQTAIKADLQEEAATRQTDWSCRDHIKNGDEAGIDCGGSSCTPCIMGIDNSTLQELHIYPNPSTGNITLSLENGQIQEVKIFNTIGELVYTQDKISSNRLTLNLNPMKSNLYHIEIQTNIGKLVKRLIKI
ncbi:MAG: sulfatase [Bacteroidetes bacterium]|nr:MAG: sulfatase [Bacteroidota bacterium]